MIKKFNKFKIRDVYIDDINESLNSLNEDKMTDYLSKNFQKLTSEIQKLQKNVERIGNEINNIHNDINNIVKLNNLKR